MTSDLQDGGHDVILRRKVLSAHEEFARRPLCAAVARSCIMQQRPAAVPDRNNHGIFLSYILWRACEVLVQTRIGVVYGSCDHGLTKLASE